MSITPPLSHITQITVEIMNIDQYLIMNYLIGMDRDET